jgi:hypothetical protein
VIAVTDRRLVLNGGDKVRGVTVLCPSDFSSAQLNSPILEDLLVKLRYNEIVMSQIRVLGQYSISLIEPYHPMMRP